MFVRAISLVVVWLGREDLARVDSERRVGASACLPFQGDLYGFGALGGFGLVLVLGAFFSLSAIIRLFVHPLSWLSC